MSARVIRFVRNGNAEHLNVSSPDADRFVTVMGKLQRLRLERPTAARIVEDMIDRFLDDGGER